MGEAFIVDRIPLTGRTITDEGYLVAPGVLARTGIQPYYAYELGLDNAGIERTRVIRLYRPPEEVFDPASIESYQNKPVTIGHPPGNRVDADTWKKYAVGDCRDAARTGDVMTGTLTVRDKQAVRQILDGKQEISVGYAAMLDMTPGTTPDGEPYDGTQRRIRVNHVAVLDQGRCGSACSIGDHKPTPPPRGTPMKIIVDGIPLELDEVAHAAVEKVLTDRKAAQTLTEKTKGEKAEVEAQLGDAKKELEAAQKELADTKKAHGEAVATLVADHAKEVEKLKKDVMTPEVRDAMIHEFANLLADAAILAPKVETKAKTCLEVRRNVLADVIGRNDTAKAVVIAVLAGKELAVADADTVKAAFNAVKALPVAQPRGRGDQFTLALAGVDLGDGASATDIRTLFHAEMADNYMTAEVQH